jgi:tetratricopeptide (TPR) repeat protein
MVQDNLGNNQQKNDSGDITRPIKIDDTQPIPVKVRKPRRWRTVLLGIFMILLLGTIGSGLGYQKGIQDRLTKENQQILTEAAMQFQYGIQQMTNGNYNLARTHFEYVLKIYPKFPGIAEKYTEVMVKLAEASIPTAQPQATPTVSNLNAEGLFNQAAQEVQSLKWADAMNTLEALRNEDTAYRTLDVDGLYYTAMRYRAIDMILKEGNLEEGLYLFSLVSRYAPLDHDAVNYSSWARLYLTVASYWGVDWQQVVNYFSQLAPAFPNMWDGSMTAKTRLAKGSEFFGDQLEAAGDHCAAIDHYQTAINLEPTEVLRDKYNRSFLECHPPTAKPKPTKTPEAGIPTDIPVEITPIPSDTQTP